MAQKAGLGNQAAGKAGRLARELHARECLRAACRSTLGLGKTTADHAGKMAGLRDEPRHHSCEGGPADGTVVVPVAAEG